MEEYNMLIGGEWVTAVSGATLETRDPATGDILARVPAADAQDVDRAVCAARDAFRSGIWSRITPSERARVLWRAADLIEAHIDELAELETLDQGKPLYVGRWAEIPGAIEQFRYFAAQATKVEGQTIPTSINYQPEGKQIFAYTSKEPLGVVGAIVPWNSPLVLTAMNIAPALAAGCSVVLKPAEDTSLTALRLGELLMEAGVPAGVINVVTGYGDQAGAALAAHMDVDKISFTGSTATGRRIVDAAKGNLKKLSLELGGKSPVVILDDADLDLAIPGAANAIFFNAGQVCIAGSRIYAHRSVYDQVVDGVSKAASAMKLGHGLDPATQMGPLVSRKQ
ncbi:MAG: aldehyde dehydrogenase family protein, partial [Chromatocurvus sp.]